MRHPRRRRPRLESSAAAFVRWRDMGVGERADILARAGGLIRQRSEQIARTMTLERGR